MAMIELRNLQKSFGETRVLNDVTLSIDDGEFLTLVGPSGCGKSTLLRILAGLEMPDAGDVIINGQTVNKTRAAARNLAMVFQSYALYPHLTVAENMLTPLKLRDLNAWQRFPILGPLLSRNAHRDLLLQVRETAEILKIEHLLDRKPGQLSGGQRQRAALGRAMVRKPVAFLMDEPLSNLDAALRVHMRAELSELHRTLGTTFIYVTHDQAEALTMSNRMAVMMGGDILQLASPDEVYTNSTDIRVAEFVGSPKINVLPGQVDKSGVVSCLGKALHFQLKQNASETIKIGLRPEHLTIVPDRHAADFEVRLIHRENLGSDMFLHTATIEGEHRVILRAKPDEVAKYAVGDTFFCKSVCDVPLAFSKTGHRLHARETRPSVEAQVA